jgi:hypothetical protein
MNKQFLSLVTAIFMLMVAFSSCKKDSKYGNPFVIDATDVENGNPNIATVKTVAYECDYVLASGEYQNNGFKLTLPTTVPEKYIYNIVYTLADDFEGTISDRKATIGSSEIIACDSDGNDIGWFEMADKENSIRTIYMYVDRNVTIKGFDYDTEFDCSFKKGWNILYNVYKEDGERFTTTQKPSNANLKWYCYCPSYNWEKAHAHDRKNPFSKIRQATVN